LYLIYCATSNFTLLFSYGGCEKYSYKIYPFQKHFSDMRCWPFLLRNLRSSFPCLFFLPFRSAHHSALTQPERHIWNYFPAADANFIRLTTQRDARRRSASMATSIGRRQTASSTPDRYTTVVNLENRASVVFGVQGEQDARILLSDATGAEPFVIVLGNSTEISRGMMRAYGSQQLSTPGLLSVSESRFFWIQWTRSAVTLGKVCRTSPNTVVFKPPWELQLKCWHAIAHSFGDRVQKLALSWSSQRLLLSTGRV
jgi:hypothetical protein